MEDATFQGPRACLALVMLLASCLGVASATGDSHNPVLTHRLEPSRLHWHTLLLEFEEGLLASLETRIRLRRAAASSVEWVAMPHAAAPLHRPAGEAVMILDARAHGRVGFIREVRVETVWFEADSGRVLQQLRYDHSGEPNRKFYRFGNEAVYRLRRGPANAQERADPERWSDEETSSYGHQLNEPGCELVVESGTLLYVIAVVDPTLSPPPWALCVFSRKSLYPITVTAVGRESVAVDFVAENGRDSQRRRGSLDVQVLEIGLNESAGGRISADSFYFLGLRLPIRLYLDPALRAPVRATGRIPDLGEIDLSLREVHLQGTP